MGCVGCLICLNATSSQHGNLTYYGNVVRAAVPLHVGSGLVSTTPRMMMSSPGETGGAAFKVDAKMKTAPSDDNADDVGIIPRPIYGELLLRGIVVWACTIIGSASTHQPFVPSRL